MTPNYQKIMFPLLKLVSDGHEHTKMEIIDDLINEFHLTEIDTQTLLSCGKDKIFNNNVGWALYHLKRVGFIDSSQRSIYKITDKGKQNLKKAQYNIDLEYLRQIPASQLSIVEITDKNLNLKNKCTIMVEIINNLKEVYQKADNVQQAFIETMIGAAIFYLPKPQTCSGTSDISIEAIKSFTNSKSCKLSEEHEMPRKIAARILLEMNDLTSVVFYDQFVHVFSKIRYVTPHENQIVKKYQKDDVFKDPDTAYQEAGIDFVKISTEQLKHIRTGKKRGLKKILEPK